MIGIKVLIFVCSLISRQVNIDMFRCKENTSSSSELWDVMIVFFGKKVLCLVKAKQHTMHV